MACRKPPVVQARVILLLVLSILGVTTSGSCARHLSRAYGPDRRRESVSGEEATDAVMGIIARLLGESYVRNFSLCVLEAPADSNDTFEIRRSAPGLIRVCGTNGVAMAKGVYWYLQKYCHVSVTWGVDGSGNQLRVPQPLPGVESTQRVTSTVKWRYYMNVCTVSYSSVWWDLARWQREIDWMALHGINLPLAFTGQEYILTELYKGLGLTEDELQEYFTGPAFLAWNRMGNIRHWAGPLRFEWRESQYELQLAVLASMRLLGMTPVLPGFSGHVPGALKRIYPDLNLTQSPVWNHFNSSNTEVFLLDPDDPHFVTFASDYIKVR